MYDVILTKNATVDFLSKNDAPWHSQNVADRGYWYLLNSLLLKYYAWHNFSYFSTVILVTTTQCMQKHNKRRPYQMTYLFYCSSARNKLIPFEYPSFRIKNIFQHFQAIRRKIMIKKFWYGLSQNPARVDKIKLHHKK